MNWILIIVLSLCIGSFMNVIIYRVPMMIESENSDHSFNICFPSSHCTVCKQKLKWWHNIPVLSFILLRFKCAYCKAPISWQYPAVEAAAVCASLLAALVFGFTMSALAVAVFTWFLICLFCIDAQTQYLPDCLTLPLLWLGLLFNTHHLFAPLKSAVYGAVLGYAILFVLFYVFKWLTQKDGLGFGDFKLLAALGAWLGWMQVPVILFFSAVLTLVFFALLGACKKADKSSPIAFGPAICVVGLIFMYFGHDVLHAWLGVLM